MTWCKRYIAIFLSIVFTLSVFSQPNMALSKSVHDFGRIANLAYPPAAFQFINQGNEPLAILMVNKSSSVRVSYPKGYIQPGETGIIEVLPDLNRLGSFNEKLTFVTNAPEPVEISVKGEVISVQACFPDPDNWNIRKIFTFDKITKDPVPEADLELTYNKRTQLEAKTNRDGEWTGEMPIGQYNFEATASNYRPLEKEQYVPRSLPIVFLEMERIPPEAPEVLITVSDEVEITDEEFNFSDDDLLPVDLYAANNLVLLLDVSYSMRSGQKLELLKASIKNLIRVLRPIDNVALITYAQSPTVVLPSVPGNEKQLLSQKVDALMAAGITNGVAGMESAYQLANRKFISSGNNQIILATDGKFTGGSTTPEEFRKMISSHAEKGVILSIIGFGVDEEAIAFMQEMSSLGRGKYIHVSTKEDISDVMIREIKENSYVGD